MSEFKIIDITEIDVGMMQAIIIKPDGSKYYVIFPKYNFVESDRKYKYVKLSRSLGNFHD